MKAFWCAVLLLVASCSWAQVPKPPVITSPTRPFTVFDGLLHVGKPSLKRYGMIELRGSDHIWRPGISRDVVDPPAIISLVQYLSTLGDAYYLDIENWPVHNAPDAEVRESVAKLIRVADLARQTSPYRRFGFYGLLPPRVYWPFVLKKSDEIAAWQRANEIMAPLADHVDFILPSLYTFYDDPEGWAVAARDILKEARRYGKPVYPFIWPAFHENNKKLAGQPVPRDFWRIQLELVRENADGVVIWGGYQQQWDEHAAWWLETQDFLKRLK